MKRLFVIPGLAVVLFLGGCMPSIGKKEEKVVQDNEKSIEETVIIPEVQLKDEFYRTLLPFKPSASRGLIVDQVYSKYDMKEIEEGLLRLSTKQFDPENHFFQEGQYISKDTAINWLSRKSETNEEGLNPAKTEKMSDDEVAEKAPVYLSHIVEQNYLVMTDDKKVRLAGISIGLALNTISYSRSGKEIDIPDKTIEKQGIQMSEEIVRRLRSQKGLEDIPIVVGLFKQESRNSIVPGTYFATAIAEKGKAAPSKWTIVDEQYVLFPTPTSKDKYREMNTAFLHFKQEIDDYFPSFVSVVGTGFYKDGKLSSLNIEIPIQFSGTSETIGFTQYLTSLVTKYFSDILTEVSISSVNGPEALIVKEAGDHKPYVHIYGY
ncbi:CamS family sex pheromone protein [Filibacter tadaridae]|uniref:CamS sex pheromone cAM373 n=1 Tax=Filibacter tadaridae TaxID=2483811 RepID=A0A3P5WG98_9BACL|nr:CamS family sex pheromone protein [Filibacter tadaridae]VDC22583.1 CamS sex pheromone cAM373 precursor [Filibacter tadaridae]